MTSLSCFSDIKDNSERCILTFLDGGLFIAMNTFVNLVGSIGNIFACLTIPLTSSHTLIKNVMLKTIYNIKTAIQTPPKFTSSHFVFLWDLSLLYT